MIQINDEFNVYFDFQYKPRKVQLEAYNFAIKSISEGNKYILINAPVGTGKSQFAIMFANYYKNCINPSAKFDIITHSKMLQDQYEREFPYISNYKGKVSYPCTPYKTDCSLGKELCSVRKEKCDSCPYDNARTSWINGSIGLTNFHLFNTINLFMKGLGKLSPKGNVLIVDECHLYEQNFTDYLSSKINERSLKKCGFDEVNLRKICKHFKEINNVDNFFHFINSVLLKELDNQKSNIEIKTKNLNSHEMGKYSELFKNKEYIENLESRLKFMSDEYEDDKDNWILDIVKMKEKVYSDIELTVSPVWSYKYIKEKIWDHYDHIIFMSGTILNKELFSFLNGLEIDKTTYVELDSPFDKKNRPVYFIDCGKMSFTEKHKTFKKQKEIIEKIVSKHKNDKGIIHTYNYEITNLIKENILNNRFLFHTAKDKDLMLEKHFRSKTPTIIVSPSCETGLDLYDDFARWAIVTKMPYLNLNNNKVKKRMETNKDYYIYDCVCTLSQMLGRTVRNENDHSISYILDSCFVDVLNRGKKFISKYLSESLKVIK